MRFPSSVRTVVAIAVLLFVGCSLRAETPKSPGQEACDALREGEEVVRGALTGSLPASVPSGPLYYDELVSKREWRLRELADNGDTFAARCLAVHLERDCRDTGDFPLELAKSRARRCVSSSSYYRKAAEGGSYIAAGLLADQYRDGRATEKSMLVAVDWYYKAGLLALEKEDRDFALRMLEEMLKVNAGHTLSLDLRDRLYPKSLGKQKQPPVSRKPQAM